jgi:hypothetical protein
MHPKVRSIFNRPETDGERNNKPSETVPDQTMTVQEILKRHSRGLPMDGQRVSLFEEDIDPDDDTVLPDPKHMDLADRQLLKESITDHLDTIAENKKNRSKRTQAAQLPPPEQKTKDENNILENPAGGK